MTEAHQLLHMAIERVRLFEVEKLVRRDSWGDFSFESARGAIESVHRIAQSFSALPIEELPHDVARDLNDLLREIGNYFQSIDSYSVVTGPPAAEFGQRTIDILNERHERLFKIASQYVPYLAYTSGEIASRYTQASTAIQEVELQITELRMWAEEERKKIEQIGAAAREATASSGVERYNGDFTLESGFREMDAKRWLYAASGLAVSALAVSIYSYCTIDPSISQWLVIAQRTASKLVILALLIAGAAWCASNYRANKHQATIGRHKAHALSTFRAFVEATDNPQVRDAVLMETTRSIFTHPNTGYVRGDGGGSEPASKIIEIVKNGVERQG